MVDLLDGGWDMAIRIGRLADSPLQARKLGDCVERVCAAPSYLDKRGVPRRVADLTQHNCLGYTLSSWAGGKVWAFGHDGSVRVALHGDLAANNGDALLAAAVGGRASSINQTSLSRKRPSAASSLSLAPAIVEAILDDVLPNHITLFDLAVDSPALWDEQRERVKCGRASLDADAYHRHVKSTKLVNNFR